MAHPLHEKIGKSISDEIFPGCKVIKDPACGGVQHIPLFCSKERSRKTKYCDVDLLILFKNKIRVIIEIEEANVKPTQICGKFLASALTTHYIHVSENDEPIAMADSVLFIQVVDTSKLKKEETSKIEQWINIKESIQKRIPVKDSNIGEYDLFYGSKSDFNMQNLIGRIVSFLRK